MAKSLWFKKAVMDKPPYKLGWKKDMTQWGRIHKALNSRPKGWGVRRTMLSSARALNALANVTRDRETRIKARGDAKLLFSQVRSMKRWG